MFRRDFFASKMSKVFVVSRGEYTEWSIDAIFSTKEKAEKHIANCLEIDPEGDYGKYELEEWNLDDISHSLLLGDRKRN